ncbi:polysialyltransferase family glycosyltransferase [Pedobacter panaciterrae]
MDWSGRYLAHKNLIVPPKAFATDLIMKMVNQLPDLINFCNEILNHVPNNSHLYLTSNLANSGLTNYENELSLYEDVIRETSEIGKCIILKNHPRASNLILKDLYEKLKDQYTVILIDNNEYSLYPIELWLPFIEKCCILPVFSSSVVSLKYFYNKDSIMPLSEKK